MAEKEKIIKLHGAAELQGQEKGKEDVAYAFALEVLSDDNIRAVTKYKEFDFDIDKVMNTITKYKRFVEEQTLANHVAVRVVTILNDQMMKAKVMADLKGGAPH